MISFLIAIKNEANYIEPCVHSILAYSGKFQLEVILVDDGSDDETVKVIEHTFSGDERVRLIKTEGVGKVAAYNLAFKASRGQFFFLLGGDDLALPESFDARIEPLLAVPKKPAATYCQLKIFSEDKNCDGVVLPKVKNKGLESGGCIVFNRAFAEQSFPIPELLPNEDNWLVLNAKFRCKHIYHVPILGLKYRVHAENSSNTNLGVEFSKFQDAKWLRARASFYFYEAYRTELPKETVHLLLCEFMRDIAIYVGMAPALFFMSPFKLKSKLISVINSKKILYDLKKLVYKF